MSASLLITNRNTPEWNEHFFECLSSLPYEAIVVTDAPSANLRRQCKERSEITGYRTKLLELTQSTSYAKMNNIASKEAGEEFLILMNSDILCKESTIESLVGTAKSQAGLGMIQPVLRYPQDGLIQSTGHIFFEYENYHAGRGRWKPLAHRLIKRQATTPAFSCLSREDYLGHGGMDEFFYNAYDGMELSLRLNASGLDCFCDPNVEAFHFQGLVRSSQEMYEKPDTGYFWARHGARIKWDWSSNVNEELTDKIRSNSYLLVNLSNTRAPEMIGHDLTLDISEVVEVPQRFHRKIVIHNCISRSICSQSQPILWIATFYGQIADNLLLFSSRVNSNDLIIDLHGNVLTVPELVEYHQRRGSR
ncbi:MAG: glycosyltransferase [Verrucomicrobiota bacterium]